VGNFHVNFTIANLFSHQHYFLILFYFVKRFALCYQTIVCPVGALWPNNCTDALHMKLGMQVGLGPGHIVLDGDPAPPTKGVEPPIFGPCLLWPNGWMDQDATW